MNYRVYFKNHKNKILAVLFASIANILFFSYAIYSIVLSAPNLDISSVWNYLLYAVTYLIILIANIRNDNFAYQGILMFIFFMVFDQIYTLLVDSPGLLSSFASGDVTIILLSIFLFLFLLAQVVIGILLYVNIVKYSRGTIDNFKKVRIYGILYSVSLFISLAFYMSLLLLPLEINPLSVFLLFMTPISEVFMSVSICFTLERLRRV